MPGNIFVVKEEISTTFSIRFVTVNEGLLHC
jgi:hypothetical protein